MNRSWSQRERRLVALLILCGVVGLTWLLIVGPVVDGFRDRAARRTALVQQYQSNQRVIGSIPRLRRQAEAQRDALSDFVVTAPTQADASTGLLDRIQRTVEASGGEVRAVDDISAGDGMLRIRTSTRLTLAQLPAVLLRLQNETPYLAIDALNVAADQAVITGRLDIMEVSFEASVPLALAKSR